MSKWKEYQLDEVIDKFIDYRGKTPRKVSSGIHLITAKVIKDGTILPPDEFIEPREYSLWMTRGLPQTNDVLLTTEAPLGEVALIQDENIALAQRIILLRGKPSILDNSFLFYSLKTRLMQHRLYARASGSTVQGIKSAELKKVLIPLPNVETQKEIVQTLSCLDRKIENLRKQNDTLEAIAQTLFKHWFVDFEFPNADGKPYKSSGGAMEPSELGEIPAGWRVGKLGDVVKVNAESISKSYQHKEIEYVDISSVGIGVLEGTTSYLFKNAPSRARRLVKHGDVIWSGVRPNRKSYLFISHPPENLVVSTGFITLTPDSIPSSYLYSWVTTESFVEYLTFNASGSAYPAIKAEHFEIADVLLPDKFNLTKFHAVIEPMREKIHQNSRQLQTLTKTRDLLLPKLMSGKLRIT
ncbi:restriction endonuclease subunit S [Coleofasciculus sp.]|uniref:restriction endonuclease subunit S n=1 Tax=Coleofasciculus sp. TaxID=3100458 RepID=UPI00406442E9